jgi:hypothetical protein
MSACPPRGTQNTSMSIVRPKEAEGYGNLTDLGQGVRRRLVFTSSKGRLCPMPSRVRSASRGPGSKETCTHASPAGRNPGRASPASDRGTVPFQPQSSNGRAVARLSSFFTLRRAGQGSAFRARRTARRKECLERLVKLLKSSGSWSDFDREFQRAPLSVSATMFVPELLQPFTTALGIFRQVRGRTGRKHSRGGRSSRQAVKASER